MGWIKSRRGQHFETRQPKKSPPSIEKCCILQTCDWKARLIPQGQRCPDWSKIRIVSYRGRCCQPEQIISQIISQSISHNWRMVRTFWTNYTPWIALKTYPQLNQTFKQMLFYCGVGGNPTGAVKITPAHDHVDLQLSRRHSLPCLTVIAGDGTMAPSCGQWLEVHRLDNIWKSPCSRGPILYMCAWLAIPISF